MLVFSANLNIFAAEPMKLWEAHNSNSPRKLDDVKNVNKNRVRWLANLKTTYFIHGGEQKIYEMFKLGHFSISYKILAYFEADSSNTKAWKNKWN